MASDKQIQASRKKAKEQGTKKSPQISERFGATVPLRFRLAHLDVFGIWVDLPANLGQVFKSLGLHMS